MLLCHKIKSQHYKRRRETNRANLEIRRAYNLNVQLGRIVRPYDVSSDLQFRWVDIDQFRFIRKDELHLLAT